MEVALLDIAGQLGRDFGLDKAFHDRYVAADLLAETGITVENIVSDILTTLEAKD